ncbi:MAG: hypothetical protein ACFFBU_05975 [Promethearchaeota archaeon]
MQDVLIISFYVVLGFAFVIIFIWMTGRMATLKRRNRIVQFFGARFRSITSKISVKLLGNTGAKLAYHQESDSPFPKLEATIMLLDRSNAFAMIYWKIRHRTDQVQIRANLKELPEPRIELITHKEQKRLDEDLAEHPGSAQELMVDYLVDQFYVVSYTPETGDALFQQEKVRSAFEEVAPYLTRLSIARREPHLFFSVILVPEALKPMEKFALTLGRVLSQKKKGK